nr:hypothetical protein BaRGS_002533 [Batillaria attramentaria]
MEHTIKQQRSATNTKVAIATAASRRLCIPKDLLALTDSPEEELRVKVTLEMGGPDKHGGQARTAVDTAVLVKLLQVLVVQLVGLVVQLLLLVLLVVLVLQVLQAPLLVFLLV